MLYYKAANGPRSRRPRKFPGSGEKYGPPLIVIVVQISKTPGESQETREHDPPIALSPHGDALSPFRPSHGSRTAGGSFFMPKGAVNGITALFVT